MKEGNIAKQVEALAFPIVQSLGYELVEVEYKKKFNGMNLTIFLYSKKGITIADCEKVSKAMDAPLEELNPTKDESYIFNVSSMGIDRPIKNQTDAVRNLGKEVEVKLYAALNGKKSYIGIMTEAEEKTFKIKTDIEIMEFEFSKIAECVPVIKI